MADSTFRTMTTEHLGQDATENDLRQFIAACEAVMASREFDRDEEGATEYVWNNGSIRCDAGACAYCERVQADVTIVPARDDDEGWSELASAHESDCEWVATRDLVN